MNEHNKAVLMLSLCGIMVCAAMVLGVMSTSEITALIRSNVKAATQTPLESQQVRNALRAAATNPVPAYTGSYDDPFKLKASSRRSSSGGTALSAAAVAATRPKLALKAVLTRKNSPFAIIANESGATFICGVGDSVSGQRVVSIGNDKVVLRDRTGTYDLTNQTQ